MPKLDLESLPQKNGTGYPRQFAEPFEGRWQRRFGKMAGLEHMGANLVRLEPGAWSSLRHWHAGVDEMVVMLSGEAVLVEDDGEVLLLPGDVAAWPKGATNGHQLQNRSEADCSFIALSAGDDAGDHGEYSDVDMKFGPGGFTRKDGTPY